MDSHIHSKIIITYLFLLWFQKTEGGGERGRERRDWMVKHQESSLRYKVFSSENIFLIVLDHILSFSFESNKKAILLYFPLLEYNAYFLIIYHRVKCAHY